MTARVTRPTWHFTTADRWLNDPNGLVWADGEYHLFFQTNPHGDVWGDMSWGHAVSTDLVHWVELGVAIEATAGEEVFSGSAVVDAEGTAGFGAGAMVAVYTGVARYGPRAGVQAQCLAFSTDRGRTWTRHEGNPVLDVGSREFRDPYVFRHGERWVMAVADPVERRVAFYTSADLRTWNLASRFGPAGATGGMWECPALLTVPTANGGRRWVLLVSLNPGGPTGGSGAQYFVGEFDGGTFTAADDQVRWLDHGHDYYAAVAWNGVPDGRALTIAWADNWQLAADRPAGPWRGAMSLVRSLELGPDGVTLRQRPVLGPADEVRLLDLTDAVGSALEVRGDGELLARVVVTAASVDVVLADGRRTSAVLGAGGHRLLVVADGPLLELVVDDGLVTFTERLAADATTLDVVTH